VSVALASTSVRLLLDPVLAAVFPSRCPCCGVALDRPSRGPLCEPCWDRLPGHGSPTCRCGLPLRVPGTLACGRCRRGQSRFALGFSLGPYQGSLRTAIHELKYRGRRRVAARLAEAVLAAPEAARVLTRDAVLVPVPLHPRRRRERGFNQSELLAAAIGQRCGLPVRASALVRRKDTSSQTGLSAAQRRGNVAGAFAVRRRPQVLSRVVVLVDDVVTTGATLRACAEALSRAGAAEVRVLTLARVD
jgi:ComF family protein